MSIRGALEIGIARRIAMDAHAGQFEESTGGPYIRHVQRVVDLVDSEDAKAVAWLHDVIEDSTYTELDLRRVLGKYVVDAVMLLSHTDPEQSYAEYIQAILDSGNRLALEVKVADLRDHLRPNCPPRLRARYEAAWAVLSGEPLPVGG